MIEKLREILEFLPAFTVQNITSIVIETIIIGFMIYEVLYWIFDTKAWTLLKGIIVILLGVLMASVLHLNTVLWILSKSALFLGLAIIVIFQPELRRALEKIGSHNYGKLILFGNAGKNDVFLNNDKIIGEIAKASFAMGSVKTGALMVIKRKESLTEIKDTGIQIEGLISYGLILNIFEKNTPLHDGAVVIEGDKIAAATCYLPLTDTSNISKDLGTRHRAAIGISEITDTITIVVSEETGNVSVVEKGIISRISNEEDLKNLLLRIKKEDEDIQIKSRKKCFKRRVNKVEQH